MNKNVLALMLFLATSLMSCSNNEESLLVQNQQLATQHEQDSLTIALLIKTLDGQQEVLERLKSDNDSAEEAMLGALMEASKKPDAVGVGDFIRYFSREYPRQCALIRKHGEALRNISQIAQSNIEDVGYRTEKRKKLEMMEQ